MDKTEGVIVDLLYKNFSLTCEVEESKTYYSIDVKIEAPYNISKPWDEQDFYYWNDVKENILFLIKILSKDYITSMVTIRLVDGFPYNIDDNIEKKIEGLYSRECELSYIVIYLIKNK